MTFVRLHAQPDFWNSSKAYLGQTPPGDTPVQFAPRLLTIKDSFDMDRVAFSDDGKEFYYETDTTWYTDLPIVLRSFVYKHGKWVGPNSVFHSGVGYVGSNASKNLVGGMDVCVMHFSPGDTTIESLGKPVNAGESGAAYQ